MANWFTRLVDRVTPWDRGGEVQRRKKREEEQAQQRQNQATQAPGLRVGNAQPTQRVVVDNQPKPQQPTNIFETLNKNLVFNQPKNTVPVLANQSKPVETPQPGTVIKPSPEEELDRLVANELPKALEEEKSRTSRFDRQFTDRNWNKRAEMNARNRALRQYQEKYGYNKQPEVMSALQRNRNVGEDLSKKSTSQWLAPVISTGRVGTGIAEGAGGLYDILTPGKGQNRFTQGATRKAEEQDKLAKDLGVDKLYRSVNVPLEIASYFTPTVASKGGKVANFLSKGSTKIDDLLRLGTKFPKLRRLTSEAAQEFLNPQNIQKEIELTGRYLGQDSAKGKPITPRVIGENVAQSAGGAFIAPVLRGLFRALRGGENLTDEAIDAAISGGGTAASQADNIRRIPVGTDIPIDEVIDEGTRIPVNTPERPTGPIIREIGGDAPNVTRVPTPDEVAGQRATTRFENQPTGRPDQRIEGVTPTNTTNTGLFTRAEIDAEYQALDDALANKEINKTQHKVATKELDSLVAVDDAPKGTPITVKQVDGINVTDNTNIPQNLPETPGTVRVTEATAPNNVKSEVVAQQLPPIPKVGSTLPDGKVVTKRMVQAARNQRKNARALVKAQEQAADDMAKINASNAPNAAQDGRQPGLVLSDETKKGKKGAYQVAHQVDQADELGTKSVGQVIDEADASIREHGSLSDRDVANVKAALDSGTYKAGSPEYKRLSDLYWSAGTHDAQRLALRNQSLRRTGSARELYNRAVSKIVALANDPTKITDKQIADIEKTVDDFVVSRDARAKAVDDFNANPTKENYDRFKELDKQTAKAEKNMAMSQYTAAKSSLKGNTNVKLRRLIEDAADGADLYTMDYVDSALLSSTGTFVRNLTNATLGSAEEGLFGGIGARIGRAVKGTPVGGGVGRGSISGFGKGVSNIVDATKARAKNAGWNPIEHMKNWSTTGNQLGDSMIEGSIGRSVRNHYEQVLKKQGYSGDELRMRADVMARTDPDNLARDLYGPQARKDAGLGSGIAKRSTFEKSTQRWIADEIAKVMGKEYSQGGEAFAKGITRITMGFPSAIGRSLVAGSQRMVPFANIDTVKAFTAKDPAARATAIKESIKKSGTAATAATIFGIMGANDMVTGAYPKDPEERARWEREGIKENSIKIGDAWYDAPSYLGSFGLPVLAWASIGRNGGVNENSLKDIRGIVGSMSPTENLSDINDMLDGKTDFGKYTQQVASSAGRMATPYGSLLNQVSKIFDTTQNDTTGDTWAEGVLNKLVDGIPFVDSNLPDKTDKEGNPLYNPSVAETMLGASGAVQRGGEERSREINQGINDTLSKIDQYGLLSDSNLDGVLESTGLEAFNKAKSGKQLDESEIKALKEGLVKGVSQDGTDTAYLEKGQYDTNLAVLKLKRDLMSSDPTVKPSSLKDIDTAIKRGTVYKDNEIPYELISMYKSGGDNAVGVEEWRNMGDPEHDDYDPDMYEKLWQIDQLMTKNGVSYKKGALDKPKYFVKEKKGGKSGSGSRSLDTSFGTLKDGRFAPQVQQYQSIDQRSGAIPHISVVRPNIVHKIGQG